MRGTQGRLLTARAALPLLLTARADRCTRWLPMMPEPAPLS